MIGRRKQTWASAANGASTLPFHAGPIQSSASHALAGAEWGSAPVVLRGGGGLHALHLLRAATGHIHRR